MGHTDWVPTKEQNLMDFGRKWKVQLDDPAKIAAYGWDAAECAEVSRKITEFIAIRTDFVEDNSTRKRIIKDEAKETLIAALRDFANTSIRFNKKMSGPEKSYFGIQEPRHSERHIGPPTSQPGILVENTGNRFEHRIRARELGRQDAVKPADAYGVRYAWQVGGAKPASGEDLQKTKFSREISMVISHTETDKAKTVYYACCYENRRGQAGPWSPVSEGIIG